MTQPKTLTEKIFSHKAGRPVRPGEFLLLEVDTALASEITAQVAIEEFRKYGGKKVYDPNQAVLVPDHFVPSKDIESAQQARMVRLFARRQKIEKYFEVGRMGIEHVILPEKGLVKPGDVVIGADSHTCTYGALGAFSTGVGSSDIAGVYLTGKAWFKAPEALNIHIEGSFRNHASGKDLILKVISTLGVNGANYKAIEFTGPAIKKMSMATRFTIANMAVEAGAKAGLFPVDEITAAYLRERGISADPMAADDHAAYAGRIDFNLDELTPQVAYPFLPSNVKSIAEAEKDRVEVDQVIIGSCTNGRLQDLRVAAAIFKGRKVHPRVRCIVFPGSQQIYKDALNEGLAEIFIDAECAFSTPTCGPCPGGHMGVMAKGEKSLSTTNRNFVGRMGHPESKIYLASPAVAAATAVNGYISAP